MKGAVPGSLLFHRVLLALTPLNWHLSTKSSEGQPFLALLDFKPLRRSPGRRAAGLVTGMPGHPIRNLRFSNLKFVTVGGIEEIAARVPEYAGGYPEGTHFGNLPGSAFYLRRVDRVRFIDCEFTTERRDARPWQATEDVVGCAQINVSYRAH
jgi:hypothetical protein